MDIFNIFKLKIINIIQKLSLNVENQFDFESVQVNAPKNNKFGDLTSSVALSLSKITNINAVEIAQLIADKLLLHEKNVIKDINIINPGFINITLKPEFWYTILETILHNNIDYAIKNIGNNKKINIEYVSANPTGYLHIGHARGAIIGNVLSNLYKFCGYDVTQEYYINDAGNQIKGLALSLYYRYCEYFNKHIDKPTDFYPGSYITKAAEVFIKAEGDVWLNKTEEEIIPHFSDFAISYMMKIIKEDLLLLDIKHDVFTSEKELINDKSYNELKHYLTTNDLLYKGILEAPKGKKSYPSNTEKTELPCLIFKTSKFGDTTDRVLEKSDGSRTYFANDIIYHKNKMQRGFYFMVDLLGVDHKGYEKRLKAAVSALSNGVANLNILFTELVNLQKNSKPIKMSKRSGNFLLLRHVLKKVPKDVFRITMISRSNNSTLDFDLVKAIEKNDKNPVYYIQYAYVRLNSVLNKTKKIFKDINLEEELKNKALLISRLTLLQNLHELEVIKNIALYPKVLKTALKNNNVHLIFLLLMDISKSIHSLWSAGKSNTELKFIIENNKELTFARLYLLLATKKVMTSLFNIVGIEKPELM